MNFSYLTIKPPHFKSVDEKLPDSREKSFKSFGVPSSPLPSSGETFLFQNLVLYVTYHNIFFRYFKALPLVYPYGQISHFGHSLRFQTELSNLKPRGFFLNCLAIRLPPRILNFRVTQITLMPPANLLSFLTANALLVKVLNMDLNLNGSVRV